MKPRYIYIIVLACFLCCVLIVAALLTSTTTIENNGQITGIRVSVNPTSINWGIVDPGSSHTSPVNVTNTGNKNETLSMATAGLPSYLSLSWDKTDFVLQPSQTTTATFTLTASATAPQGAQFSFNITVTGTG